MCIDSGRRRRRIRKQCIIVVANKLSHAAIISIISHVQYTDNQFELNYMGLNKQGTLGRIRRLAKIALMVLIPLMLLLIILWHVVRSDHKLVIEKVQNVAQQHFELDIQLEGYQLEWAAPYPLLRFHLRNLSISSNAHPQRPVFRANLITSEFNPWDLLTGDFQAHPLHLDSAWVFLYTDSLKAAHQAMAKNDHTAEESDIDLQIAELPSISANFLDFHRQDDFRKKWQRAKFSHLQIHPRANEAGKWYTHIESSAYFDGLVFKAVDGGFLTGTPANINWRFALVDGGKTLQLLPSTLAVHNNTFSLQGRFGWDNSKSIRLQIATDGITMDEVRPLLSNKIDNILCDIQIDQPIQTEFSLVNADAKAKKEAINIAFATNDAVVNYKDVSLTSAVLRGIYSNDCDEDGAGAPETSCITFEQLDGDIYGVLPARLQGIINNMEDPLVDATGQMKVDLPRLNPLLTSRGKATFAEGTALVNFKYHGILENILAAPFANRNIHVNGNANFNRVRLATVNKRFTSPSLSGYMIFDETQTLLEDIDLEWMGSNIQLSGRLSRLPEFFFYEDQPMVSDLTLHFDKLDLNEMLGPKKAKVFDKDQRSRLYHHFSKLCRQLAENVNGRMQFRVDQLFYDTLMLTDFRTQLRLFTPLQETVTDSSMIRLDSLFANFMGDTPIHAAVQLSGDKLPKLALDLYMPAAVRPLQPLFPKQLHISRGNARLSLSASASLQALLTGNKLPEDLRYRGVIQFQDLDMGHTGLPDAFQHINGTVRLDGLQMQLHQLHFQYRDTPIELSGKIDGYDRLGKNTGEKAYIDLQVNGRTLDLRGKTWNKKKANDAATLSPPTVFRSLNKVFPHATGRISVALDGVKTKKHHIHPLLVDAQLLTDTTAAEAYQLRLDSFYLGMPNNSYFKGNAMLKDPAAPSIAADLEADLHFEQLGTLLPSRYVRMQSGRLLMDLTYQSPLYDTLNAPNYLLKAEIDGHAEIDKGMLRYTYRDFTFEDISGHLQFDQRALFIHDLDLRVNGNRLIAQGQSSDFFPFFVLPDRRANIKLKVNSPHFDFGQFTAPHGLGLDSIATRKTRPIGRSYKKNNPTARLDSTRNSLKQTVGYIDQLLDRGALDMSTNFETVVYDNFSAQRVNGRITLAPDTVQLHDLHMNVAEGHLAMTGQISNIIQHQPQLTLSINMDQNNVRDIFQQFNNFGQQELAAENVKGLISADLDFKADINSNYDIRPETLFGDLGIKLVGGELIDLKLFNKMSGFLFRNRGLDHVILDTLQFRSYLRGSDLYLEDFHLHSSSFDFGAMGRYSLGADKHTRILLRVPIRNFFRRHISAEEMTSGKSKRKGMNLLIEARHRKGKMRFIWRPILLNEKQFEMQETSKE